MEQCNGSLGLKFGGFDN